MSDLACIRGKAGDGPRTSAEPVEGREAAWQLHGCARAQARAVPQNALRTGHAQRSLPHAGGGRRGRSGRAVDSRKIW